MSGQGLVVAMVCSPAGQSAGRRRGSGRTRLAPHGARIPALRPVPPVSRASARPFRRPVVGVSGYGACRMPNPGGSRILDRRGEMERIEAELLIPGGGEPVSDGVVIID